MTEKRASNQTNTRGYKPSHEKWIPAAMITLVVISIGMLTLAVVIALGVVTGA